MDGWSIDSGRYGKKLNLHVAWKAEFLEICKQENIQEVALIKLRDPGWESLDFLSELSWIKGFLLIDFQTDNIAGLHFLVNLRYLQMNDYSEMPIDFSKFPLLEDCRMEFTKGRSSIAACTRLESLFLQHYSYPDLSRLYPLKMLRKLSIAQGSLRDISGIELFKELTNLTLALLRNLKDLGPLESLTKLENLQLEGCKAIGNVNGLSNMTSLIRLDLSNCRNIESLEPLLGCRRLEFLDLSGDTNVLDGNLAVLRKLPNLTDVRTVVRKHYNVTSNELLALGAKDV